MIRQYLSVYGVRGTLIATFAAGVLSASSVLAQTSSYQPATDNVVINWNALGGGTVVQSSGPAAVPAPVYTPQGGRLLMPGPQAPQSQLYVAVPGRSAAPVLKKPGAAKPAATMAAKPPAAAKTPPAPKPAPAAKPAAKPATAPAPAPAPAPPVKVAKPAAPPPAPKAPAASTASAPPPPPVPTATPSAPPAPAKVAEAPKPAEPQQAAAPTSAPADGPAQISFNSDNTKLSLDGQKALDVVISKLSADDKLRVQLMAYAAGEDITSSKARRISLSRALSVRSYLIEKGVRSTRIDVRALGDKATDDPRNRVDVNTVER